MVTAEHPATLERIPLSRRELAYIGAFWLAYAFLNVASRLLDVRGMDVSAQANIASIVISLVEASFWALLTPGIFAVAARVGVDRNSRAKQVLIFAAVALPTAIMMAMLGRALRGSIMPPRPAGRGPGGGPPLWLGVINGLVIFLAVLTTGLARAWSFRYRARKEHSTRLEAQLAGAQLESLRRQLDPHFLFNTLNMISALVERDPRAVRRMISRLSELLRFSLDGAGSPEITLRDELAILERYLDITRMRFEGRLEVTVDASDDTLDMLVPSLLLQPLVENAIKHGVEKLRGSTTIALRAWLDGETLMIEVRNEVPAGAEPAPASDGSGVGLSNSRARLAQLHGRAASLDLRLDAREARVQARMPARQGARA
ncbi:MAG: histidine kinase internal region [Gemmatimonadetes bacterium]|nr:histidine kinase internal region [Gemmatimonadota bacterium]